MACKFKYIGEQEFFQQVADHFINQLNVFITKHSKCRFVLSGGGTPIGIFEQFVKRQSEVDWSSVELFWLDERCVEVESNESNFGMARRNFIDLLDVKPKFFPMYLGGDMVDAARDYEALIASKFSNNTEYPVFDLALVGVGVDGHIASLFPGSKMLTESQRLVSSENVSAINSKRISMTIPLINRIKQVVVVLKGEEKMWVLGACKQKPSLPICKIALKDRPLIWFISQNK